VNILPRGAPYCGAERREAIPRPYEPDPGNTGGGIGSGNYCKKVK